MVSLFVTFLVQNVIHHLNPTNLIRFCKVRKSEPNFGIFKVYYFAILKFIIFLFLFTYNFI